MVQQLPKFRAVPMVAVLKSSVYGSPAIPHNVVKLTGPVHALTSPTAQLSRTQKVYDVDGERPVMLIALFEVVITTPVAGVVPAGPNT